MIQRALVGDWHGRTIESASCARALAEPGDHILLQVRGRSLDGNASPISCTTRSVFRPAFNGLESVGISCYPWDVEITHPVMAEMEETISHSRALSTLFRGLQNNPQITLKQIKQSIKNSHKNEKDPIQKRIQKKVLKFFNSFSGLDRDTIKNKIEEKIYELKVQLDIQAKAANPLRMHRSQMH